MRAVSYFVLGFWLLLAETALAQPRVEFFTRPGDATGELWAVDVYVRLDRDWLQEAFEAGASDSLRLVVDVRTPADRQTAHEEVVWPVRAEAGSQEILQRGVSVQVPVGTYRLQVTLRDTADTVLSRQTEELNVGQPAGTVLLSDLIPLHLPSLSDPPFARLLWPEAEPDAWQFVLYYEVYAAEGDTVLPMRSVVEDAEGRPVHEEEYTLFVYYGHRSDYLPVDLFDLPEGEYTVRLQVVGASVERKFHFIRARTAAALSPPSAAENMGMH